MPRLGWQESIVPQILSLRTKQPVRVDNNGLHHRNEQAHPSQVKPQSQASYKLQQSDGIGYDRNRSQLQGQKRGHIWSYRSHSARLVCTCIMVTPPVHQRVYMLTSKNRGASIYLFVCEPYLCRASYSRASREYFRYFQPHSKQKETHSSARAWYLALAARQRPAR
jgi:hypothetical protein